MNRVKVLLKDAELTAEEVIMIGELDDIDNERVPIKDATGMYDGSETLYAIHGLTPGTNLIVGDGLGSWTTMSQSNFLSNNNITTADANLTDDAIIRGKGGAKGIQTSLVTLSDEGTLNIPSEQAYQINGASINTGGTLTNVAYLDQANVFGDVALSGITTLSMTNTLTIIDAVANSRPIIVEKENDDYYAMRFADISQGSNVNYVEMCEGNSNHRRTLKVVRNLDSTKTGLPMANFIQDNSSDDQDAILTQQDGIGAAQTYDKNNSGTVINIDLDANDGNPCYGIQMNLANAGAGIEYAFYLEGSEITTVDPSASTNSKWIKCWDGSAIFYIRGYT